MNDMSTVPTDKPVVLHLPGGVSFRAELYPFEDADCKEVWGWVCLEEGKAPADWTDDVCWAQNEDDKPSTKPVGWSHTGGAIDVPA